ncbi:hypothetical protein D3C73_767490 [compost metagenome]
MNISANKIEAMSMSHFAQGVIGVIQAREIRAEVACKYHGLSMVFLRQGEVEHI